MELFKTIQSASGGKLAILFAVGLLCLQSCKEKSKLEGSSPFEDCPEMNECDLGCPDGSEQKKGSYERYCAKPDGTRHGPAIKWHDYTHPSGAGEYVDGKLEGTWMDWYPLGEVRKKTEYENGVKHGEELSYYKNGTMSASREFSEGVQVGVERTYYEGGEVMMESTWRAGEEYGTKTYFYEDGQKKKEATVVRGCECGHVHCWSQDGSPQPCAIMSARTQACCVTSSDGAICSPCE